MTTNHAEALPDTDVVPDSAPPTMTSSAPRARLVYSDGITRISSRPPGLRGPFLALWATFVVDGEKLRALREQQGLSVGQLARKADLSATTISRLEKGHLASCKTGTLIQLANTFAVPPEQLAPSLTSVPDASLPAAG